jgi:hypothetical protein
LPGRRNKAISECDWPVYDFANKIQTGWGNVTRKISSLLFTAMLALCAANQARSEDAYPNRVIRFIVGFAAGGGNDLFARRW